MRRAAVAVAVAVALSGCGLGPGEERDGGAELRVTRDFGQVRIAAAKEDKVREGQTVMRFLQSERKVETRFGGKFVQTIDGVSGSTDGGGRRDWFYFVNGIEADVGAADRELAPGDVVQWDNRRWDAAMRVPAIVGAFPEPFRSGEGGRRIAARVECESTGSAACRAVKARLSKTGVKASSATIGAPAGRGILRVLVGRWRALRGGRAASRIEDGPKASGVFARFAGGGSSLELLDEAGLLARRAPAGSGLVAATEAEGEKPVWLITGVDEDGVAAAAALLGERSLRDAFAVAATPDGPVKLPVLRRRARS
jgi:Domain of unknown function (DUF4430)